MNKTRNNLTDTQQTLPSIGACPATEHVFEEQSVLAIQAALAAGRPLLVRGEPGMGKSQLARATAFVLKRAFITEVVHARTESQDLLWHFDAVGRLGEAQALAALGGTQNISERLDPRRFLSPGPLWWVLNWESAEKQFKQCSHHRRRPQVPGDNWEVQQGCVLLIDEIDKADADVPNGLLDTLANGSFSVPYLDESIGLAKQTEAPLVIITTNEERELPAAFLRRCLVLSMALPKQQDGFIEWMLKRGQAHFKNHCSVEVCEQAAQQLWQDRQVAQQQGLSVPGQAEYLDLLRAVSGMTVDAEATVEQREKKQRETLTLISHFMLKKHPEDN